MKLRAQLTAFSLLARGRVSESLRSAPAAVFLFVAPALLLLALGATFSRGHPFERRPVVLSRSCEGTTAARSLSPLDAEISVYFADDPRAALHAHTADVAVLCDANGVTLAHPPRATLLARALADTLTERSVRTTQSTVIVAPLGYARHLLAGAIAFSVLLSGLYGVGPPLLRYRSQHFLAKLSLTPLSRTTFLCAQLAARAFVTTLQLVALVLAAALLFRQPVTLVAALLLALAALLGLVAFAGIGLMLASWIDSDVVLSDAIAALMTPLALLSEAFFPARELPPLIASVASFLPSTLLVRLIRAAFEGALDARSATGLALWALVSISLGVRSFDWTRTT